jgi:AraC-like DNA-binding protein
MSKIKYFKSIDKAISIVCGHGVSKKFPVHRHLSLSVGMVVSGSRILTINKSKYIIAAGDIFIINSEEPHCISDTNDSGHDYIVLSVALEYLKKFYPQEKLHFINIIESAVIAENLSLLFKSLINDKEIENVNFYIDEIIISLQSCIDVRGVINQEDARLEQIRYILDNQIDVPISLEELADKAFLSMFHFSRLFKKHTGLAPHQYLLDNRLRTARNLLERGMSIGDIAIMSGFYDSSHFVRHFTRYYGVSPLNFQKGTNILQL